MSVCCLLSFNVSVLRQPCAASGRVCPTPTATCAAAGLVCYIEGCAASRRTSPSSVYSTTDCATSERIYLTAASAAAGLVCYTEGCVASRRAPTRVYSTADCATSESICFTAACAASGFVSVLWQPVLFLDGPGLQKHVLPLAVSVLLQNMPFLNVYV
jgi:hypothetical protein